LVGCADGCSAAGEGGEPGWPGNWVSVRPVSDAPAPFSRKMKKRGPCSASWAVPAIAPTVARTAIAANIFFPARDCRPFVSGFALDFPGRVAGPVDLVPGLAGRVAGPAGLVPGPAGLTGLSGRVAGPAGLTGAVAGPAGARTGLTGLGGAMAGAGIVARPPGLPRFSLT
jgi:hypothetical protein